jgi:hypothetical protein
MLTMQTSVKVCVQCARGDALGRMRLSNRIRLPLLQKCKQFKPLAHELVL